MRSIRGFHRDEAGLSALEFALVLPVMCTLLFGGIEITNALEVSRKVSLAAATAADLVAQTKTLTNNQRDDVFAAADALMTPKDPGSLTVVITSLVYNNGQATVVWSDGHRKLPRNVNDIVILPPGILATGTSVIMAEVTYQYLDPMGALHWVGTGSYNFTDTYYDRPRRAVAVARTP